MMQDLIQRHFGVAYHPHYSATLLKNRGLSYQKARFVSEHLNEAKRLEWRHTRWPKILRQAQQRKALLLCGAEASFAGYPLKAGHLMTSSTERPGLLSFPRPGQVIDLR
jgi:Winged helix-turn helix